jgi:hypothetical protein
MRPRPAAIAARIRVSHGLFAAIAAGVYAAAIALAGLLPRLARPEAVAVGMTIDMVVIVPLAFYILLVRGRGWPLVTLAPVLVLSFIAATRVLPADHHQALRMLELLAAPLELGLIGWIAWRAARALRHAGRDAALDPVERLERAAFDLTGHRVGAAIVATEIGVLRYGLFAWRARPHAPAGARAFTHHQACGHGGILLGLLLLLAVEGFALHFLLMRWNPAVAWAFTIASVYSALWLVADYRATVLRPILVDGEAVRFRAGLRWSVRVARARIAGVERREPESRKERVKLTFFGAPTHWVRLSEPVWAQGPYGLRRRVRALGLEPDAAEAFREALVVSPATPVADRGDLPVPPLRPSS